MHAPGLGGVNNGESGMQTLTRVISMLSLKGSISTSDSCLLITDDTSSSVRLLGPASQQGAATSVYSPRINTAESNGQGLGEV